RDRLSFPTRPQLLPPSLPPAMKRSPRLPPPVRPTPSPPVSGARRRRVRCRKCEACVQGECGVCRYCRDMKKFGGPGRMKQSCVLRQCLAPRLPYSVTCSLCGEVDQNEETQDFEKKLMECCICNEVVHPGCLQMDGEGLLNDELPNCWECPKCYQPDNPEKVQRRKMDDSDEGVVQAKVLRPLRSREEPLIQQPPHSSTTMLQLIHDPGPPRGGMVTRSSPGAGPSDHHSASRDERFKRRQLRLQATQREKENNPSGKKELSEVDKVRIRGTYLMVTPQRSNKELQGTSIVPKLQAITASSTNLHHSPRVLVQHCPALTPQLRDEDDLGRERDFDDDEEEEEDSAEEEAEAATMSQGSWTQEEDESWMQREIWLSVFRYLNRRELCECMRVCKTWYKWCCDKRLWTKIDLSRCKAIVPQALSGIIKRQPVSLDLSWTNISKKQLTWLVNRLPGLKDLLLAGCSWSAVSALSTSSCPLLRTLDLRWAVGIKDPQIRDLLTPPTDKPGHDNRSKLRNMTDFRLAGLDITDATLRLIIRHMPLLSRLDLSHCSYLTDQSPNLLTAVGSSTRNSLTEINMAGCNKLTDQSLFYLRRISNVTLIDLRGCKQITRKACEHFISDLSINNLYCLSDEKLIQKIS
ncbi:lysine-specific demethylase 2A-like, partial [Gracilinanus agilis]|uniref:lysine-specific demethylase 2A-like n=1 Tax=Gracilinanus agilis TaxID=191870 RepID=UPI001CFCF433